MWWPKTVWSVLHTPSGYRQPESEARRPGGVASAKPGSVSVRRVPRSTKSTLSLYDHLMKPPIDIDDPTSWPADVYKIVAGWAKECTGRTEYTNDLPLRLELEAPFRERLTGQLVRAYHYTRLMPQERQTILDRGLQMLSADLLAERIESARFVGAISVAEAEIFQKAHVFVVGE